jgi:predicted  nucleic acid-binding Zn-ribbon protein
MLGTRTPAHRFNILPGETDSAPPTRAVTHEIPEVREKARNPVQLEQQIRELTERAEAQGQAQSTFRPETGQPYDANAQLLEEIRMLKSQMSAIQQQQQHIQAVMDQGLPEYTSSPT